ncbi:phosphotransferase [Haloarcula argentinensis]|uniref:Fructosamine kinase family protein n=1 Tax=Haloarcula argentinensis TaxID=43776 RepID=A0ABU2EW04_HALAR|nr:phosphotransferase [Haloarcula argentinensis]EMA22570.1 aminoglycoside phosphotransferase [Haloarcula argentinensis DSM 12282]MDS0252120.1 fructosamine kinase family protein [Haloarcula argentinensis]
MREAVKQAIEEHSVESRIIGELHNVPPYRVYEIQFGSQRAVLKIDDHRRGHAADEGRVHEYVATGTTARVPDVLAVGTDHYITTWDGEIAEASPQVDRTWARAAGVWMGTLHADTRGAFDGFGKPRSQDGTLELTSHKRWVDGVIERVGYHRSLLAGYGYTGITDTVEVFFQDNPAVFDGVGEPVLCHGDVHPEHHVQTSRGGITAIDFEHALVAPAEYDYWRTVMPYFEANHGVGEAVPRAFQAGYESVKPLPDDFEERRPLYQLMNDIAFLESLYLQQRVDPEKREQVGERIREHAVETLSEVERIVE